MYIGMTTSSTTSAVDEFETSSCVRGYHVYQDTWTPVIGEQLVCRREDSNPRNRCAVAVVKAEEIVGHVPRFILTACSLFIRQGGSIYCTITESRRYSRDLPKGGMEIPCTFRFVGNGGEMKKLKKCFKTTPLGSDDNTAKHVVLDTDTVSTSTMIVKG